MAIQKKVNGTWQPITPKKLKGLPYTGTLPAVLTNTKAGYLHRYKVHGNTEQVGTPTPENPIAPQECGEKTENLFDKDTTLDGYWLSSATGVAVPSSGYSVSDYIRTSDGESYTLVEAGKTFCWYNENKGFISTTTQATTASAPTGAVYFRVNLYTANKGTAMVVKGSTALPYEPYGYKLPLTSAGQNVDIYLGESQTTRRIKKIKARDIVWTDGTSTGYGFFRGTLSVAKIAGIGTDTLISNKYKSSTTRNNMNDCEIASYNATTTLDIVVRDDRYSSASDWLLANGDTDIYYVLDTPETAVVNEPLRKIGDYADTIDSTQTTAQIPTAANSTTISWAGSGLAPSQFDSIQEWVDAQTYTRVNGEWVADN